MEIRAFVPSDTNEIVSLFYETVHCINKKDYTQEQIAAWAPYDEKQLKLRSWSSSLYYNITYVALIDGVIVGFSDMTREGYLDRLYVHKDYQRQGIASALIKTIEAEAVKRGGTELITDASITARAFFESFGYEVAQLQKVKRKGVELINFKMRKRL